MIFLKYKNYTEDENKIVVYRETVNKPNGKYYKVLDLNSCSITSNKDLKDFTIKSSMGTLELPADWLEQVTEEEYNKYLRELSERFFKAIPIIFRESIK